MIIWRKWLGIAGGIFPGGKEACLEQAERILKNSFVFQEHWEMERTHEAVVFGDKIEWDAVPFGDPGMALCVEQAYLFSDSGEGMEV